MSDEGEYIRTPRYDPRLVLKHATASLAMVVGDCGMIKHIDFSFSFPV